MLGLAPPDLDAATQVVEMTVVTTAKTDEEGQRLLAAVRDDVREGRGFSSALVSASDAVTPFEQAVLSAGEKAAAKARKMLRDSIAASAEVFAAKPFFLSDEFTLLDASIIPILWRLDRFKVDLPKQAKAVMDRGELVSDDIVLGLLEERLAEDDAAGGFILDGFPRNIAQAEALDALLERLGQPVDEALQIDFGEDQVVTRIAKRAALEGRSDDTEETVRNRLDVYAEQTAPVVDYYAQRGVLSRVLGDGSIEEVFERIRAVLQLHADD